LASRQSENIDGERENVNERDERLHDVNERKNETILDIYMTGLCALNDLNFKLNISNI